MQNYWHIFYVDTKKLINVIYKLEMINLNSAFEDELFFNYLRDPDSVSPEWRAYFEKMHGSSVHVLQDEIVQSYIQNQPTNPQIKTESPKQPLQQKANGHYTPGPNEKLEVLDKTQSFAALGWEESLRVPTATSTRTIPVKALDENRRIINRYLMKLKRTRVSFTHILAWAVVRSLMKYPRMNDTFQEIDGVPHRVSRKSLNIGLAVDITKKDGRRLLFIPSIKDAQDMTFTEFADEFDRLIENTRNDKLTLQDLQDTTITLTNPGMIGTTSSIPRLMKGQGAIIASGLIDYPVEFQAVRPELLTTLAVSKVVTLTSTYDHRVIQGAESAEFLAYINRLLLGEEQFYDQIFYSLKIPFEPIRWAKDYSKGKFSLYNVEDEIEKGAHVMQMINAYRVRGHLLSSINPLGFDAYYYPELDPAFYGFTIWDLDRVFHADDNWDQNNIPLRDIIELLRETYCGSTGFEFMHIQSPEKKDWIKRKLEKTRSTIDYSEEEKSHILKKIVEAEMFENFLHTKFVGHKRFSLEGAESVIVLIDKIFEYAANNSLNSIVLGMAHRGRLNVLANLIGKSYKKIFNEFDGEYDPLMYQGSGDVKYHLGSSGVYKSLEGNTVKVVLSPNPSHLELVDPLIAGMARAIDNDIKDAGFTNTLPITVHGDAAFAGQGIVAETLNLSELEGYRVGGTIHIIINNQIGFTTSIDDARSSVYATDIAKMIQAPIVHVNGNDPEAVRTAALFACEYRAKFKGDVIIDMLCYRKYGHNEADEPTYTQPLLYKKIKSMELVSKIYESQLLKENSLTKEKIDNISHSIKSALEQAFDNRKESKIEPVIRVQNKDQMMEPCYTAVSENIIDAVAKALTTVPSNFKANPKVLSLLKKRDEMVKSEKPLIDWALAELLSFGTILLEGKEIRFSGQDTRRGTFSQRHAVLVDIQTENDYIPLNNIAPNQSVLRIFDSPLSETAVLGFEYGYSVIAKRGLTIWEAQFGDFYNNAQSIVDQFISCAEVKWGQSSNLVMLLPHSYDGQGPEHSSARLERFLQLCAEENMFVANLTTPAQYFHILRRQTSLPFRIPLILMTPKGMLRHPLAVSSAKDLAHDKFHTILDDREINDKSKVKTLLFSTGKIYYELYHEREQLKKESTALIRIEQLYPFDRDQLSKIVASYPNVERYAWVQEEPRNMGAWTFIKPYMDDVLPNHAILEYVGRKPGAATATGLFKAHLIEQETIINQALID